MTVLATAQHPAPHPGMELREVWVFSCHRCPHVWCPRVVERPPRVCPKCKSPYWDRPRRADSRRAPTDAPGTTAECPLGPHEDV